MPFLRRAPLLALAVGAPLLVAGCGNGELPATDAKAMLRDLDQVEQGVRAGKCEATRPTLRRLDRNVAELPDDVDAKVRTTLGGSVDHLERLVGEQCRQREPEPVVTEPEPVAPPPVESTPEPSPAVTEPPLEAEQHDQAEPKGEEEEPKGEEPQKAEPQKEEPKKEEPKKEEPKKAKGDGRDPCPPGSSAEC